MSESEEVEVTLITERVLVVDDETVAWGPLGLGWDCALAPSWTTLTDGVCVELH